MAGARSPRSRAAGPGGTGNRHPGRFRPEAARTRKVTRGKKPRPFGMNPSSLPSGASLTVEPGGQLELSSAPAATLGELVEVTGRDLAALRDAAAAAGLELCGYGLDPLRPPRRLLDLPRYAAMEKFFDRDGPWGRQMMCGTASVQVCVDAGDDSPGQSGYRSRWRMLHAIGPVLVAAFANSPLRDGKPTGWRSARQQVWANMDPGRTRAPACTASDGGPARRLGRLRAGRRAHVRPRARLAGLDRAGRGDLPRLAARRRLGHAAGAHRRGPGLSPVHAVPAGPPARAHGAADDRRAARRRLDRARGRGHAPWPTTTGRPTPRWPRPSRCGTDRRTPGTRGCGRPGAARPTRRSARPASSASRPPTPRWAGSACPPRSAGRSPTSPNATCRKTDVPPTTNWRESDDDGGTARPGNPARRSSRGN